MKKPPKRKPQPTGDAPISGLSDPLYAQFVNFSPRKGDIARAKILSSTIHCIAHLGIEKTGFESIGKFAGMRRAHVAYYYPDRDQLVLSAIQLAIATAQQSTVSHVFHAPSDQERLKAYIRGIFDWAEKNPDHLRVVLLFYYYCSVYPQYRELHDQIRELGAQRILAVLKPLFPSLTGKVLNERAKAVQNILTGNLVDWTTTSPSIALTTLAQKTIEQVYRAFDLDL